MYTFYRIVGSHLHPLWSSSDGIWNWVLHTESRGRPKETAGHSKLVDDSYTKQEDLWSLSCLAARAVDFHTCLQHLQCIEVSTGFSHISVQTASATYYNLKARSLGQLLVQGRQALWTPQRCGGDEDPQIAWVQLEGPPADALHHFLQHQITLVVTCCKI